MDKNELLKSIGFSEEYIEKLNKYSEETIEVSSTSVVNEVYSDEIRDTTNIKIEEVINTFNSHVKCITK